MSTYPLLFEAVLAVSWPTAAPPFSKMQLIDGGLGHRSLLLEVMGYSRIYGLDFFFFSKNYKLTPNCSKNS